MEVKILNHTPEPERVCAVAALSCYSRKPSIELIESMSREKVEKILRKVIELGHHSTLEHASFTFGVKGVSRALTHQLVRHRIASYSQQSQRYVRFAQPEYIVPQKVGKREDRKIFDDAVLNAWNAYNQLIENGVPEEDARYVLPNATATSITITMNARELLHFFSLRCCNRAQWEIKKMAKLMLREVRSIAPIMFERAGAYCDQHGYCNQGEMGCGRYPTLREIKRRKGRKK